MTSHHQEQQPDSREPIVSRSASASRQQPDSTGIVRIVSLHDVDRDITIPPSTYLRWAMEARWQSFEQWEALKKLRTTPGARMMVKAQCVRQTDSMLATNKTVPGKGASRLLAKSFHPGSKVEIIQTPYSVSAQSFTLAYEIRDADHPKNVAANVFVVMVCTFLDPDTGVAKASKLPEFVSQGLPWLHRNVSMSFPVSAGSVGTANNNVTTTSTSLSTTSTQPTIAKDSSSSSSSVPTSLTAGYRALSKYVVNEMPEHLSRQGVFSHEILVRSSDEDVNHHVTHSRFAEFFQDALSASLPRGVTPIHADGHPSLFYIEYMRELHAGARCDVFVLPHDENSVVLFVVERVPETGLRGATMCRALASWEEAVTTATTTTTKSNLALIA